MKLNWHVLAARCAAENPYWSWPQVCAHIARRKRAKPAAVAPKKKLVQLDFNAGL